MRMYILIKADLEPGIAVTAAAHAALAGYLKFTQHPDTQEWLEKSFRKVICRVNDKEFERAKEFEDHLVMTESALEGAETAIVFRPRAEWPKPFRFYSLWK